MECVASLKEIWSEIGGVINMLVFLNIFDIDPFDDVFFMWSFGGIVGLGSIFQSK